MKKIMSKLLMLVVVLVLFTGCTQSGNIPDSKPDSEDVVSTDTLEWPEKPIQIIVGAGAGGDSDFNARAISEFINSELGQPAVVVNVSGGGGSVGARQVYDAKPDGYNVLLTHTSLLTNIASGMVDFDLDDFEMIGVLSENPGDLIIVNANSEFRTLDDLVKAAKAEPNKYNMAVNTGSTTQIIASMLESEADCKFNFVDGGGTADKTVALLGQQIDVTVLPYGASKDYIESGDFRPLAVVRSERNEKFSDIPTAKELGYDIVLPTRYFLVMPNGTPQDIVNKFTEAVEKIVTSNTDYAEMINKAYSQDPLWMDVDTAKSELKKMQDIVDEFIIK
ncbi:MAG: tripartite tricarboxylate transporter substrate binding protein [Tissierellaceae bacterium]|nr:tripartite tricarboxylate transporter substrate binding protein [Tissierellaceae bacterium]